MIHEKKRYTIPIFDDEYVLVSDEPEAQVYAAAAKVHTLMEEISLSASNIDPKKIAVLVALRLSHELIQAHAHIQDGQRRKELLVERIDSEIFSA